MENPNYVAPEETTYDIPRGWPKYPVFPDSGDVPGPPIQFEELVPDSVKAGYTFTDPNMTGEVDEYFYHGDHISSVILVTDKKAKVVQQFAYMPFGELLVDNSTVDLDYRFSAKETDRESGLGYFGARYYDNTSAMWLGVDPLWEKYAGMNPYNYCAGNPVMLVDRDGRKIITYSRGENNEAIEYHFVTGEDGKGAFFDNNGNEYNKNEQFIIDLTDALNVLNEGKEGRSLVSNLENIEQNITIFPSKNSNSQARYVVRWNPQNRFLSESTDISGNKERPSYIGLAHEMAHVQDYLNGTFSDNVWYINAAGNKIITAEQYATFIENKIRDEHRIPLRAFYNDKDDPESSLIIFGANGKITARYYNHTFKQVKEYGKVKF